MSTKPLPPIVSPSGHSGKMVNAEEPPHPFDTPFILMKKMKAEIDELRQELRKEQEQREHEVAGLRQDVQDLRDALAKEKHERISNDDRISTNLATETSIRNKNVNDLKEYASTEFARRTLVSDFEALSQRVKELEELTTFEKKAWRKNVSDLERQIDANTAGDNVFAQQVVKQLRDHKKMLDDNAASDAEFANHVMPRFQLASQVMLAAGSGQVFKPPSSEKKVVSGPSSPSRPTTT